MKLVLDQNMPRQWLAVLREAGHDAILWAEVGPSNADDIEICRWADANGRIVVTLDLDFGTILRATGALGPSVIILRARDGRPPRLERDVLWVLGSTSKKVCLSCLNMTGTGYGDFRSGEGTHMPDFYCDEVLSGRLAVETVAETDTVLAFRHTRPHYATHIVVTPKRHVESLAEIDPGDELLRELIAVVQEAAALVVDERGGAHVVTNLGKYQDSKHLHFHVGAD